MPQKGQHAWRRPVRSFGPRLAWWLSQVGTYRLSRGIAQNLGGFNTKMVSFWIGERPILGNTQMFMKISMVEALNSRSSRMSGARIMPQAWGLMMFDLRQCVVFWGETPVIWHHHANRHSPKLVAGYDLVHVLAHFHLEILARHALEIGWYRLIGPAWGSYHIQAIARWIQNSRHTMEVSQLWSPGVWSCMVVTWHDCHFIAATCISVR